jgi:hypothetical protein
MSAFPTKRFTARVELQDAVFTALGTLESANDA